MISLGMSLRGGFWAVFCFGFQESKIGLQCLPLFTLDAAYI